MWHTAGAFDTREWRSGSERGYGRVGNECGYQTHKDQKFELIHLSSPFVFA
jgi:hypothetical protein